MNSACGISVLCGTKKLGRTTSEQGQRYEISHEIVFSDVILLTVCVFPCVIGVNGCEHYI